MKICTLICFFTLCLSYGQQITPVKNNSSNKPVKSTKINPENGYSRCLTTEYEEFLRAKNPQRLSPAQFENWIAPIIATQKENSKNSRTQQVVFNIPVVIHVIHNGDPINTSASHTGENISYAQAASQITVLNQDFRRMLGTPGNGSTGYNLGVDCEINFVLAQQDENGILTNGVDRVNMGQTSWSVEDIDAIVKPQTQWDPTKYLNMWVVRLSDETLLGYAQFPSNSTLGGINTNGGLANSDGVVASYNAFGTIAANDGTFEMNQSYNLGRTMTHEVGHWLGLIHIWGDDATCTGNNSTSGDYVTDTPDSNIENYTCVTVSHCIGNDMIENYMDYTNDACMNTFTAGQKARMVAVMTNSLRRKELPSSTAGTPGTAYTYDAKVANIAITVDGCKTTFSPSITIENRGTTTLTTVSITYSLDNISPKTYTWTGSLPQYATTDINLSAIASTAGAHIFYATINTVNNQTDLNATNNDLSKAFTQESSFNVTTTTVKLDLQCDRDGTETTWTLKNSAGSTLYSGGPYKDSPTSIILNPVENITFALTNGECYTFTIYDSFGDGIATNGGKGSYILKDANGVQFASGGVFTFSESKSFLIATLGIQDFEAAEGIYVYPNPSKGILNVKVSNYFGLPDSLTISSSLGQIIYTKKVSAEEDLSINTSSLSNGVYFITVLKDNKKKTLRFIKE